MSIGSKLSLVVFLWESLTVTKFDHILTFHYISCILNVQVSHLHMCGVLTLQAIFISQKEGHNGTTDL